MSPRESSAPEALSRLAEAVARTEAVLACGVSEASVRQLADERAALLSGPFDLDADAHIARAKELAGKLIELDGRLLAGLFAPHAEEFAWLRTRATDVNTSFPALAALAAREDASAPGRAGAAPAWSPLVIGVAARYRNAGTTR